MIPISHWIVKTSSLHDWFFSNPAVDRSLRGQVTSLEDLLQEAHRQGVSQLQTGVVNAARRDRAECVVTSGWKITGLGFLGDLLAQYSISLQVKDLILLEMVIQNQYLLSKRPGFTGSLDLQGICICCFFSYAPMHRRFARIPNPSAKRRLSRPKRVASTLRFRSDRCTAACTASVEGEKTVVTVDHMR